MLQWLHGRLHLSNLGSEISNIENLAQGWALAVIMASATASSVLPELSRTRLRLTIFLGKPVLLTYPGPFLYSILYSFLVPSFPLWPLPSLCCVPASLQSFSPHCHWPDVAFLTHRFTTTLNSLLPSLHALHRPLLTSSKISFLKTTSTCYITCSRPSLLFRSLSLASKGPQSWPNLPFPSSTSHQNPPWQILLEWTNKGRDRMGLALMCSPSVQHGARNKGHAHSSMAELTKVCKCNPASENTASHSLIF